MQPVEAITRLLAIADQQGQDLGGPVDPDTPAGQDQLAVSITQAMLNTALPVARFRAFVRIESGGSSGHEYTICATKIEEIVTALKPLTLFSTTVYVSLWEQKPMGADMLSGYQGKSKVMLRSRTKGGLAAYLASLSKYSVPHAS